MEKIKLDLYRFADDITVDITPKVDDSDLVKMLNTISANKDEMVKLGQQFNLFMDTVTSSRAKFKPWTDALKKGVEEVKTKTKTPQNTQLSDTIKTLDPMKGIDLGAIGASNVNAIKSQLEGILDVIQNIKNAGSNTNLVGLEESLKRLGIFESLSPAIQNTVTNLGKMQTAMGDNKDVASETEKVLKQMITTLDNVATKHRKNAKDVNNERNQYLTYKDVVSAVNNSLAGLVTKFNLARGAMRKVSSYISQSVVQSADYVESINLFNMALDEYADSLSNWVKEVSNKLYLDPSEVYQYTGSFYNLAKGLGVAGENAAFMAKNLTQLTYDMTSYLNLKPEVAYNKLLSAMSGQTKAVTNVGIAVQRASLQELANKMGIEKKVETMTQAEKTYLRYIQIMRSTTQMQGDLGRTIITPTNAMRLFQTQITLTARAIGQVLTPIIMKLLPYLIALTQLLQEAAQRLAKLWGFNLQDYEVDASGISKMFNDIGEGADTAEDSVGKLNRTLAKFDDLNVVESSSSGAGSALTDDIDFSKYLTGYDMLKDYTSKMADQIEIAKKNLEKFFVIAKDIAIVLGAIVGIRGLVKLISGLKTATQWVTKMWKGWKAIDGVTKGFKGIGTMLGDWVTKMGGITKILGGIALLVNGLIVYFSGFGQLNDTIKNWYNGFESLEERTKSLTISIGELAGGLLAATAGATLLFGPVGGMIVAGVGGVLAMTTALIGQTKAIKEMEYQQALLLTEFANTGPTMDVLNESFKRTFGQFTTYNNNTQELMKTIEGSQETLDETAEAFDNLGFHIKFGDYEGEIEQAYTDIETNLESLTNATTTHYENLKQFQVTELEQLAKDKAMTQETYQQKKKAVEEYYAMLTSRSAQYNAEYASYLKQLADGTINQEEYNKKMADLNARYSDVAQAADNASASFESYSEAIKDGINIAGSSADKIKGQVDDLTSEYEKQRNAIELNYETQRKADTSAIADAKDKLKLYKEGSDEYNKTLEYINQLQDTMNTNYANHQADLMKLNTTYTTTMQSLYKTMEDAGLKSKEKYKDVMNEMEKKTDESMKYLSEHLLDYKSINTEAGAAIGYAVNDGVIIGFQNGQKGVFKAVRDQDNNIIGWMREDLGIHSPSKVTTEMGQYITEGLANGIISSESARKIDTACKDLVNHVKRGLEGLNTTADFKISVNIEDSFNNILNKLQIFCNNWRNAINDLAKNMQTTMNGIKVDGSGKVTYSKMPSINVKKFENSGYPKSGEMFFMNENGRAEYMTKVGNKTAVVNQDHMTTALADTITRAIGSIPVNNQTGDIVVYIGNDKVYQGQGQYQSSETDRYGTTYIRI